MRLWIGHYLGNENQWFLVWATDEDDAISLVDSYYGEPDVRSLKEIDLPGCLTLAPEEDTQIEEEPTYFLFPNDEEDPIIECSEGMSVDDWVKVCVSRPFGRPEKVDKSSLAREMGINQPRVLAAYKFKKCPNCGSDKYSGVGSCSICGYKGDG